MPAYTWLSDFAEINKQRLKKVTLVLMAKMDYYRSKNEVIEMKWWLIGVLLVGNLQAGFESPKIAVIGGGLSGMTAAYRLKQAGLEVEVFEAKNRLGGRVFSVQMPGEIGELGAQNLLNGGETEHLLNLIKELGLKTVKKESLTGKYFLKNGQLVFLEDFIQPWKTDPEGLKLRLNQLAAHSQNMEEVLNALFPEKNSLYEFLCTLLTCFEGGGIKKLSPLYVSTLFYMIRGGVCQAHPDETYELLSVEGGNGKILEKIGELVQDIHLNHPLQSITQSENERYKLTFAGQPEVYADLVILAIPTPVYENIAFGANTIPDDQLKSIQSILYGKNAKMIIPSKSPLDLEKRFFTNQFGTFPISAHLFNIYYKEFEGCSPEELCTAYQKDIAVVAQAYQVDEWKEMTPVLAKDELFASYEQPVIHPWAADPFIKGTYSFIASGQEEMLTILCDYEGEKVKKPFIPVNHALFFAGEHCSTSMDVPGTMEAAVESGEKVARLILKLRKS